jgi:predicted O-linked N-acetylglucosamine transferase (SPINDLY family)
MDYLQNNYTKTKTKTFFENSKYIKRCLDSIINSNLKLINSHECPFIFLLINIYLRELPNRDYYKIELSRINLKTDIYPRCEHNIILLFEIYFIIKNIANAKNKVYEIELIDFKFKYLTKNELCIKDKLLFTTLLRHILTFDISFFGNNLRSINEHLSKLQNQYLYILDVNLLNRTCENNKKIKLGIVSQFINKSSTKQHVINTWFYPLIENLPNDKYEKILITTNISKFGFDKNCFDDVIILNNDFNLFENYNIQINELIDKSFDILLFTDIGMTMTSILLANHRIAPKQITVGGHPITTGIKTIDLFVVKKTACDNINYLKKSFSEQFAVLNSNISFVSKNIILNEMKEFKTRKELNLPENMFLISCFQCSWKYSDIMFSVFNKLLAIENVRLILQLSDKYYKNTILNNIAIEYHSKIIFFETQPHKIYLSIQYNCDIILDTFPFNGGTTSLECFSLGKIIIGLDELHNLTNNTIYLPQTCLNAYYNIMDIYGLTFKNINQLINSIKILSKNTKEKKRIENVIERNSFKLYEDSNVINEWMNIL